VTRNGVKGNGREHPENPALRRPSKVDVPVVRDTRCV
jgi:hypothetical protein